MKYVRLNHPTTGDSLFVSGFSLELQHSDLAAPYLALGYVIKSAAFFHFDTTGRVVVHGFSHGLNVGPASDDPEFIDRLNELQRRMCSAQIAPAA